MPSGVKGVHIPKKLTAAGARFKHTAVNTHVPHFKLPRNRTFGSTKPKYTAEKSKFVGYHPGSGHNSLTVSKKGTRGRLLPHLKHASLPNPLKRRKY